MQYLLDFVQENVLDPHVYCQVPTPQGEWALSFRREEHPHFWEVYYPAQSPRAGLPAVQVPCLDLLAHLSEAGADLGAFERQLLSLACAQVVVAHQLLEHAREVFGGERIEGMLQGHAQFARELQQAVRGLTGPRLTLVHGQGDQTENVSGHLHRVR